MRRPAGSASFLSGRLRIFRCSCSDPTLSTGCFTPAGLFKAGAVPCGNAPNFPLKLTSYEIHITVLVELHLELEGTPRTGPGSPKNLSRLPS